MTSSSSSDSHPTSAARISAGKTSRPSFACFARSNLFMGSVKVAKADRDYRVCVRPLLPGGQVAWMGRVLRAYARRPDRPEEAGLDRLHAEGRSESAGRD